MSKIRVLQFGSSNELFGAERWILALVRYCNHSEVENTIFTVKDSPTARIDLIDRAKQMGFSTDLVHARGPFDPRVIFRTAGLIRKHKADIMHTHGYKSDIIGYLAAKLTGIPVISTPHGSELSNNSKANLYHKLDDKFLKWVNMVVPVSEGLKDEYLVKKLKPEKIQVIKNSVDILEVEETKPDRSLLSMKNEGNIKIVGYVGQLIERKGLPNLIKAMVTVVKTHSVKLIFVGEGPMRDKLVNMAAEYGLSGSVEFLGFRPDRIALMKCFDVFVLPSYIEGIPRVIMEAMAARVPVIASDIPGIREIVHHDKTGCLVSVDSPNLLANCILQVMNDTQKAERLSNSAFEHVRRNHSAERMAQEYTELYRNILCS
jgi:glycosyltransferase involved in cell wall biosynthesis